MIHLITGKDVKPPTGILKAKSFSNLHLVDLEGVCQGHVVSPMVFLNGFSWQL